MKTAMAALMGIVALSHSSAAGTELEQGFAAPPDSARMWTWWFWLGDMVDEDSITADLEALKAQGIAGVTVYSISGPGVPGKGPNYMSPEWRGLWKHTLKEADRLGLGVSAMLCSGWDAGGPWIKPEQGCKRHLHSELVVSGPQHFKGRLPQPEADPQFYRDVAVQAFPVVSAEVVPVISASSSHPQYPVGNAADGNGDSFWVSNGERPNEGPSKDKPEWLQVDLGESRTVNKVTIQPHPGYGPRDAEFQLSSDGSTFTTLQTIAMGRDQALDIELPNQALRYWRLLITSTWSPQSENVQVCEVLVNGQPLRRDVPSALMALKTLSDSVGGGSSTWDINEAVRQPLPPAEEGSAIDPASIIDLSARCGADGFLDWEVPAGHWKILRTGMTLTGAMTTWSSPTGIGLEADPLDASAMDFQFANVAAPLIEDAGPLVGKVFRSVQIDSWEINHPNWTAGLLEGFRELRGYDPLPYLPVLAGHLVGNAGISDRFLYDYRKTVGDLLAENYFGRLSTLAEASGIVQQSEAGGVCSPKSMALDCLKNLGRCAIPMGEFWHDGNWTEANQNKNGKQTASAAHLYGKRIAAAEAFTSGYHWTDSPATLKPSADRAFCEGFNHFFIFSSATRSGEGFPGTEFCAGTHFNRKITWWHQARSFSDYIARCSHLLQQGLFAADVLFYNGDGCPNFVPPKHIDPALGSGYDYDACNSEIILTRLGVRDGRIVLPDGMSYRVLVLPERADMPLEVLTKLKELVAAGMTLVGSKPQNDPGLKDYPLCDQQVVAMADEMWGDCDGGNVKEHVFGKGRVVWGIPIRELLNAAGVQPDFAVASAQPDTFLDWIHRRTADADIYFIANRNNRDEKVSCTFRVSGRQPELWNPVTGATRDLPLFEQTADKRTVIPLEFGPYESYFVVFRKSGIPQPGIRNFQAIMPVREITGPWTARFDPQWFYPTSGLDAEQAKGIFVFAQLEDWSQRPEEAIKYFSGTAVYTTDIGAVDPELINNGSLFLDLGTVKELAKVRLNGRDLGVVWCNPWRVAIPAGLLKPTANVLEVEVTNLWPNRLTGDSKLPPEQRRTTTNWGAGAVLPAGLLGPVRLIEGTLLTPPGALMNGVFSAAYLGSGNFDTSVGLSSSKTYLNKVDLQGGTGTTTINGVGFARTTGQFGSGWSLVGAASTNTGYSSGVTGSLGGLLGNFNYGSSTESLRLSNLTAGQTYVLTFYNAAFGAADSRFQSIATSSGTSTVFDENLNGSGANLLRYTFVAGGTSETVMFNALTGGNSFNQYGFSTEQVFNKSWSSGSDWTTATWSSTGAPNSQGANASFGAQGSPTSFNLDTNQTVGHVRFAGGNAWTLAGSNMLTLQADVGGVSVLSTPAGSHTLSVAMTWSNNVLKTGAGTLVVAGPITDNGRNVQIGGGGTLEISNNDAQSLSGTISGSGSLRKSGAGALTLSGKNSYVGQTSISGGTLKLVPTNRLVSANFTNVGTAAWTAPAGVTSVRYLVVGGGGGGGGGTGGGGGAGGFLTGTTSVTPGTGYPLTVGDGGAGGSQGAPYRGSNGGNSVLGAITAIGGAGGGSNYPTTPGYTDPVTGGAGGGGSGTTGRSGSAGTAGQGGSGGAAGTWGMANYPTGGGGGAGGVGGNGTTIAGGGAGGAGHTSDITGSTVLYAGGGGGGVYYNTGGANAGGSGGSGVGGTGGMSGATATSGTANTGGGGGGQGQNSTAAAGSGGSGIVVLSYPFSGDILPVTTHLTISSGATFDLNGGSQQVASLADSSGGGTVINSATGTPAVLTLSPTNGWTNTFSGGIGGGGISLVINGSGTQILSGSNTYTGATTVTAGALLVNSPGSLAASAVAVASGATFGGTGTADGAVTFRAGAKTAFTVTSSGGPNTTPLTIAGVMTYNATEVHLSLPANLPNGTYTLATSGAVPVANGSFPVPVVDSGSYASGGSGVVSLHAANKRLVLTVAGGAAASLYQSWSGGAGFTALNSEGVFNGMAWMLGAASPSAANTVGLLPKPVPGGSSLTLRFLRVHDIRVAKLRLQYNHDPTIWPDPGVLVPANLDGIGTLDGSDVGHDVTRGTATDEIKLTIPAIHAQGGRLFARLAATEN